MDHIVLGVLARFSGFNLRILRTLSGEDLLKYVSSSLKLLDSGRTRWVYTINTKRVLKLAKNSDGVVGNQAEVKYSGEKFAPKVIDHSENFDWVIAERVTPVTEGMLDSILKSRVGLNYYEFLTTIGSGLQGMTPSHSRPSGGRQKNRLLKEKSDALFEGNSWYRELCSFVLRLNLDPYELHPCNLGLNTLGSLVVTDLGPSFGKH